VDYVLTDHLDLMLEVMGEYGIEPRAAGVERAS